ncbi:EPIDERMAL PATTERNING FACTOR-like protein 8 [Carica papaya]|uniref:EPIDERMAL PATTERNING FACTOR-like protein 8 n=1 Tax=Carica papaya TaxID=3649 RepID=UPI000B8CFCA1|nr:EPIDERMAL PATTERNING FACTOR-like protein 8 [Carica papaya]
MNQSLKVALLTLAFIFSLPFFLPDEWSNRKILGKNEMGMEETEKMVLGSRPPRCVNKCMKCNPCLATLVISPHQTRVFGTTSRREEGDDRAYDDPYYLLSWKCKCGNKLFEP